MDPGSSKQQQSPGVKNAALPMKGPVASSIPPAVVTSSSAATMSNHSIRSTSSHSMSQHQKRKIPRAPLLDQQQHSSSSLGGLSSSHHRNHPPLHRGAGVSSIAATSGITTAGSNSAMHYSVSGPSMQTPPTQPQHIPMLPDDEYEGYFQFITDRILVASQPRVPPPPSESPFPQFNSQPINTDQQVAATTSTNDEQELFPDASEAEGDDFWNLVDEMSVNDLEEEPTPPKTPTTDSVAQSSSMAPTVTTTPYWTRIARFLEERSFLWLALDEIPLADHTTVVQQSLRGQVIHIPWQAAGPPQHRHTFPPTLGTLLQICYAASAWLQSTGQPDSLLVLGCANGQTKTALAAAAVLKFLNIVPSTQYGFCHFVTCTRDQSIDADALWRALPPSVRNVLQHLDDVLTRDYLYKYPLRLKALAVQGIPVTEKPCIEIYDMNGKLLYASHPHVHGTETANQLPQSTSFWSDEDGFYQIGEKSSSSKHNDTNAAQPTENVDDQDTDVLLQGDFCIIGRFGGSTHEANLGDASQWLFRYVQSTAFVGQGIVELPQTRVDLMRRYEDDLSDFLLSLVVEPYFLSKPIRASPEKITVCGPQALPPVYKGVDAMEEGWRVITQYHSHQPIVQDIFVLQKQYDRDLAVCPQHLLKLALQLTVGQVAHAHSFLVYGFLQPFWMSLEDDEQQKPPWPKNLVWKKPEEKDLRDAVDILDELVYGPSETDENTNNPKEASTDSEEYFESIMGPVHVYDPFAEQPSDQDASLANEANESSAGDNNGKKESAQSSKAEDQSNNGDARAGLMAAIASKVGAVQDSKPKVEDSPPANPRAGLMAAIAAKARAVQEPEPKKPPADPRAGLMAAIAAKAGAVQEPEPKVEDSPPVDPRAGLMAAIAGKAGSTKKPAVDNEAGADVDAQQKPPSTSTSPSKAIRHKPDLDEPINVPVPAVMSARVGDVYDALVPSSSVFDPNSLLSSGTEMDRPALPMLPVGEKLPQTPLVGEIDDPNQREAVALFLKLQHAGVTLDDLANLVRVSREWSSEKPEPLLVSEKEADGTDNASTLSNPNEAKGKDNPKNTQEETTTVNEEEKKDDPSKGSDENSNAKTAMKNDDRFAKYLKMRNVGLPDGAIKNAMTRDGVEPSVLDLDWNRNYEEQTQKQEPDTNQSNDGIPMKEDERFIKYWKMKSVGLPDGAVANAMTRDGVDPKAVELDWDKNYEAQTQPAGGESVPSGPPMKEDERFIKYWKMKSVGLPDGAVANAMSRDGVDPKAVELDWDKNYEAQTQPVGASADTGPALKDDPEYAKYFKMLAVGLPPPAVQNAMSRDGVDPKILDLDPNKSVASQLKKGGTQKTPLKKKKKVRRKKIYWTPIDPGQIKEDSLWNIVKGRMTMQKLKYDVKEFESLFTESADPADKKKQQKKKGSEKKEKKSVQVIDGKRSMNGGIILLRLRMAYNTIADMVDKM